MGSINISHMLQIFYYMFLFLNANILRLYIFFINNSVYYDSVDCSLLFKRVFMLRQINRQLNRRYRNRLLTLNIRTIIMKPTNNARLICIRYLANI